MVKRKDQRQAVIADLDATLHGMDRYRTATRALLVRRIGRRGGSLLFFALLDAVYAYSLFVPAAEAKRGAVLQYVETVGPLWFWGVLWAVAGGCCLVSAFRIDDRIGFAAAITIKMIWGLLSFFGAFARVERAYVGAVIWLCLAGFVAIISSWPEPPSRFGALSDPTRREGLR